MHRLLNLCLWQVIFAGLLLGSTPEISAQETGIAIRGPKGTDAYPYKQYGPINSNDTLWRIAQTIRPNNDVSIYQVMQAIYQRNPNAFADNNINHLRNGQYITVPTLAEILLVDDEKARQKSAADSQTWVKSEKADKTENEEKAQIVEAGVSIKDLETAKVEINEQLQSLESEQKGRLETIQRDVLDSIDGLQAILNENAQLKNQLANVDQQLDTMREVELAKEAQMKRDNERNLQLLQELLARQEEQERLAQLEKENAFTESIWFKVLLGVIPVLLLLSMVVLYLRKKNAPATKESKVEDKSESPSLDPEPAVEPDSLDDNLDLDSELSLDDELAIDLSEDELGGEEGLFSDDLDDELGDELTDDDVIHLDDELDDGLDELDDLEDISLDETFEDSPEDDNLGLDDDLDGLIDEGDNQEEDEPLEGGELDQNDLDDLLSGLGSDETPEIEVESEPLENNELDQGALDDLLGNLDEPESDDAEISEDVDIDESLSAEATSEIEDGADVTDPDDIEALLASAAADTTPEPTPESEPSAVDDIADGADVTDPDDIEALLASAAADTTPEPTPSAVDDIADGADVTDPDDIEALLASAAADTAPEPTPSAVDEIADGADVTDPDDIEALLASAAADSAPEPEPNAVDEIADGADVTDPDDIEALLASAAADSTPEPTPEPAPSAVDDIADGADVTDPDDIEALLASAAADSTPEPTPEPAPSAVDDIADGADVTDPDDIEALLASATTESAPEPSAVDEIADGADVTDPDDIDALLASAGVNPSNEISPATDETANAPVEETDPEDIDAIIDSLQEEEPPAQTHEITDPDEIDALLEQEPIDDLTDVVVEPVELEEATDEGEVDEHAALIDNFSEEYVAPFLSTDFSDLLAEPEQSEPEKAELDQVEQEQQEQDNEIVPEPVIQEDTLPTEEPKVPSNPAVEEMLGSDEEQAIAASALADDIDIDALMSDVQAETSEELDIGDDILSHEEGSIDVIDEDTQAAMDTDFDESTLSELLREEKEPETPVELSPDFTDSNVLADLLAEGEVTTNKVEEASVIDDIQELDSLDFDELLANIEESTTSKDDAFDLAEDIDEGLSTEDNADDIGDEIVVDDTNEADFVSVDSLLSESLDANTEEEPYNKSQIDVGLDEFPEFTNDVNDIDVDDDDNGIAAKLDLAKVYIEIGDTENAEIILQDVLKLGDAQQQFDAQQLIDNLK